MDSGEDSGSFSSVRLISPSKTRSRGSVGELVEFCAESVEGSKQYVRQELAQDPCGHDLLPPPALSVALPSRQHSSEGGRATPLGSTAYLTSPPCSSPDMLDVHAPVGSGSSDGTLSSRAGSQPGTACGLGGASPLGTPPGDAEVHNAMDVAAALGMLNSLQSRRRNSVSVSEQHFGRPSAAPSPAQLQQQQDRLHMVHLVGDGFSSGRVAGSVAPLSGSQQFTPPQRLQCEQLQLPLTGQLLNSAARRRNLLSALERPEGDLTISPARSAIDEIDFVHVSLTPIRTRAQSQEQNEASPPISYPDSLVAPASDAIGCGVKAAAQQGGRPTFHLVASSGVNMAPPGAYNPYDRAAMAGGYGYGGGRSYGSSYGAAPAGAPTTSSTGGYWANYQRQTHSREAEVAAPAEGPASGAAPSPASGRSGSGSGHRAAAAQPAYYSAQQQGEEEEEVEHIVMIPGMPRRRKSAGASAQPPAAPAPAPALAASPFSQPALAAAGQGRKAPAAEVASAPVGAEPEAGQPALVDSSCGSSTIAAVDKAVGTEERVHASGAAAEALAAEKPSAGAVIPPTLTNEGTNLLKQVLKVALMAGAAVVAAVPSQ